MSEFVFFIRSVWDEWVTLVASVNLIIAGVTVPIYWLFIGFFIIGMIINAFWKGASA